MEFVSYFNQNRYNQRGVLNHFPLLDIFSVNNYLTDLFNIGCFKTVFSDHLEIWIEDVDFDFLYSCSCSIDLYCPTRVL